METLPDAQSFVSYDGLFTNDYKEFLLPEAMDDNIDVYYDAPTGQLVLGQTDVQGGLVVLYGDMLSTGSGNINVLDGYGAINVVNNTSYPLVTSGLSTGEGTAGLLKITDTGKENSLGPAAGHGVLSPEWTGLHQQLLRQPRRLGGFGRVGAGASTPARTPAPHGELSAGHRTVRLGGWAGPLGDCHR